MEMIEAKAPTGDTVVDYDRTHLALYAALLDAADAGRCWRDAATALMGIDIADPRAEACWRSHLDRSEEHTSELQSLMRISYAVFCLKKKKNTQIEYISNTRNTLTCNDDQMEQTNKQHCRIHIANI